ncbi:MAG TPA: VOC family protein [Stellaceae bacterium]|jgi:catechol 2,3-dioxygenase-like lactoylglutathione lyase family enzyme
MPIMGLEAVVYGVDDVDASTRFLSDFGLEKRDGGATGATLTVAGEGTRVELRQMTDAGLPAAVEPGPTLREIVWAVSDKPALQQIGAELAKDRAVKEDADGTLHVTGPSGFALAFALTKARRETAPPARIGHDANQRLRGYERAVPDHLGHMGVYAPNIEEMATFYQRLGFTVSDVIKGAGIFVRAPGSINHHSLLIARRPNPGMQHLSLRVADIDELGVGMTQLVMKGWKRLWGPGRHRPGSDMFVFFQNPAGSTIEYHCDEDFIVDVASWQPREFEPRGISHWGGPPPPEMVGGSGLGQGAGPGGPPR